ncbi:hypothetical protein MHK_007118 [Candidatus Magnetomorum sp. HK-1]|nr:hypothetical protein MHK_007118 [Candidatus Magnetomorum sp. HK-1]
MFWKRKVEGVCCDNIYLKNENVKFETVDITVSLRNNYSAFLYTTNGIIYGDIIESGEEVKTVKGVEHMYDVSDITQHAFNSENQPWVIYANITTGIVLFKQGDSYGGIRIFDIYQKQIDEWYHQFISYEYWHGFPIIIDFSLAPDFNK